jgi:hypothetical protein
MGRFLKVEMPHGCLGTMGFQKFETPTNFQNPLRSQDLNDKPRKDICAIKKDDSKDV